MKKFISLYLLLGFIVMFEMTFAQTSITYEKIKTRMWGDPDFKTKEIPEKWKNESAVIIAKSYEYEVEKEVLLNYIYENIYLHKRIMLLDKSAINDFSELSFENDYKNSAIWFSTELKDVTIGIKVIKPGGKENIIDLKEAVLKEIKEGLNKREYKKIAIPDLEVGDIIDYFYVIKNTYVEQYMKILDPVFYQLVDQYPITKQRFKVRTLRRMYFNSKSINGAPELHPIDKEDETSYSLVDKDREKAEACIWAYPFRIYPTLKFQAFFIRNKALNMLDFMEFFLKDKKSNNSSVDIAHIDELVKKIYETSFLFNPILISEAKDYLNKNFEKTTPNDTIVMYTYYFLRNKVAHYSSNTLMLNLSKVLENRKIPHDLVITIPNYISDISDLILPRELAYLIRIKGKTDYLIGDFSWISAFKSINSDYQGNNAYAVCNPNMENKPKVQKIVIPIDAPEVNKQINNIHVKFAESGTDSLQITIDKTSQGICRDDDIRYFASEKKYNDEVSARLNKIKAKVKKKTSKQLKEEKEKLQEQEQQLKDGELALKNNYKNEYDAGDDFKIESCSLKNMGIWDNSPELQYIVSFKIGTLVKKMGPNYLISIGKFITSQLQLSKKDLERKVDVYAPNTRMFEYNITFEIPLGYKVKGMEKLIINISNPTGGFITKPEMQNNNLVINVKKYYSHNYEKASEWPKMVEFIEAAFNFTQQNILLEKQ